MQCCSAAGDLVQGLVVAAQPVHDGHGQAAVGKLDVALGEDLVLSWQCDQPCPAAQPHLGVELLVDVPEGGELEVPGLGAGAEVAAHHQHCVHQLPGRHQHYSRHTGLEGGAGGAAVLCGFYLMVFPTIIVVSYNLSISLFFQASAPNALISDKLYVSETDNLWVQPTGSNFKNIEYIEIMY